MSASKRYVLDANVFIQASQAYYAFDFCPAFWLTLVRQHTAKRIFSIDKVKAEITVVRGPLREWVRQSSPKALFKGTADHAVGNAFSGMVNWVQNEPQFTPEAKAEFARVADGWLVAYAKANGLWVVTHEVYAPDAKKKVPIPNVCLKFDVNYCDTFEMLSELNVRFVLKKHR